MEIQELSDAAYNRYKVEKLAKNRLAGRSVVDPREINLEFHAKQAAQTIERTRFYMCMYEDARQYDELMSKEIVEAAKHSYMLKNISFKIASKETAKTHLDLIAHMFKQAGELKLPYNKNKRVIK
ncbi:MAG: hypothetical protein [Caudoviricetes sp.]|nr:MAG: hypothetical protein [Caudoviricetes sp.]